MIEGSLSSSESERDFPEKVSSAANSCNLKPKWHAKIALNRQHISQLMHKILLIESSNTLEGNFSANSLPSTILDRLQIKQKILIQDIPHLIFNPSFSPISRSKESMIQPEEAKFVRWLKERGYTALATKLSLHNGYPNDEIEKIQNPIIEQLVDIYSLCLQKSFDSEDQLSALKIIDFALDLASLALNSHFYKKDDPHSHVLVNDTKQILGQLIYLINQVPHLAFKAINVSFIKDALENIKEEFSHQIQIVCLKLEHNYIAHSRTQLQDPEIALHTRIPVEIAEALSTDIGKINVGIIDLLSNIFLTQEKPFINHEVNLSYALSIIQRSTSLRAEIEKIQSQRVSQSPSQDIIQVSLGLLPDHPINHRNVLATILSALLSHLRQGDDGSCFAISLAIEILSAHLYSCFKDLKQILEEGKLSRGIEGIRKDIPFIKRISDENLHKKITFNAQGEIIIKGQKGSFLWEAPGLQAVCLSLGLVNPQEEVLGTIEQIFALKKEKTHALEIKILIQKICERAQSQYVSSFDFENLYVKAFLAFSSQTSQPLLKIWENAIASMAEAEEGSMVKTAILESCLDALQFKLGELNIPPSLILQRLFLFIQKSLYERIQLQYDPFALNHYENHPYMKEGGFVLYDQNSRIDREISFRQFIHNILSDAHDKLCKCSKSQEEKDEFNEAFNILNPYIDSDEFIGYLLARYHPANKQAVSQLSQGYTFSYELLQFTPWVTRTGNNSKKLLKIYFESDKPISVESFVPSTSEIALTNMIEMCKRMSDEEKCLYLNNPNKLKPFCILGKHRLPFMAGHPSFARAWRQENFIQEWLNHSVIDPGKEIASSIIDLDTVHNLNNLLEKEILPDAMSQENVKNCLGLIEKIPKNSTIQQYRDHIQKICQNNSFIPSKRMDKFTLKIDTALCQSLCTPLKEKLENSAIHFADTNWSNGVQDIHFCFVVNPGTGQLEMFEVFADGSNLKALKQEEWLINKKWEFLTIPEDVLLDDACYP